MTTISNTMKLTVLALALAGSVTTASAKPITQPIVGGPTRPPIPTTSAHPAQECIEAGGRKWLCTPPDYIDQGLKTLLPVGRS
jgi:hypothetical protein